MERRAKILATLGPASASRRTFARLLQGGADAVRLNLSHGDHEQHREMIRMVRQESKRQGRHVPVMLDLMGPRYRLGTIKDGPRELRRGQRLELGESAKADLPIGSRGLLDHLRSGERILIDNGLVELVVESKRQGKVIAKVVAPGPVSTRKGINLPDTELPFKISRKDRADIAFAVEEKVDYLAVSYVASAADLKAIARQVTRRGGKIPLVAKIERAAAIEKIDELVAEASAVMVARGDLGVEVPLDRVPVLQKRIIDAGRRVGTPVIVATQMLESMMERPRPTRAEATDVANAVFDGADALMLSGETAAGDHPVKAVRTMNNIIGQAEDYDAERVQQRARRAFGGERPRPERHGDDGKEIADVISAAAVLAADEMEVRRLVAFSQGGFTARSIARYRPTANVLVFTNDESVARQVQLVWGVRPLLIEGQADSLQRVVELVDQQLIAQRLIRTGEKIVLLMGDPIHERPLTNLMRVHRVQKR